MKKPLLNQEERMIILKIKGGPANRLKFFLAQKKFARDIAKEMRIYEFMDWLTNTIPYLRNQQKT